MVSGEAPASVLREGDARSWDDRGVAEEIAELQEEERAEQGADRAEDDEALGVRETRCRDRLLRGQAGICASMQDDAAPPEGRDEQGTEEHEPGHERQAGHRVGQVVPQGCEYRIGVREHQREETDHRQREEHAAEERAVPGCCHETDHLDRAADRLAGHQEGRSHGQHQHERRGQRLPPRVVGHQHREREEGRHATRDDDMKGRGGGDGGRDSKARRERERHEEGGPRRRVPHPGAEQDAARGGQGPDAPVEAGGGIEEEAGAEPSQRAGDGPQEKRSGHGAHRLVVSGRAPKRRSRPRNSATAAARSSSWKSGHMRAVKKSSAYALSHRRKSLNRCSPPVRISRSTSGAGAPWISPSRIAKPSRVPSSRRPRRAASRIASREE